MGFWLRIFFQYIHSSFRKGMSSEETSVTNFRVWFQEAEIRYMGHTRYPGLYEMGRWDFVIRTGFMKYVLKNKLTFLASSLYCQYLRPVKRFEKVKVTTRIAYWDEKFAYFEHEMSCKILLVGGWMTKMKIVENTLFFKILFW